MNLKLVSDSSSRQQVRFRILGLAEQEVMASICSSKRTLALSRRSLRKMAAATLISRTTVQTGFSTPRNNCRFSVKATLRTFEAYRHPHSIAACCLGNHNSQTLNDVMGCNNETIFNDSFEFQQCKHNK